MSGAPVTIETLPAQTVAYAVCSGAHGNVSPRLNRLFAWLKEHGLQMKGAPGGLFRGSPAEAAAGTTTWELFAPVDAATADQAPDAEQIGIKRLTPREVAAVLYRGPYATTGNAYPALMEWISANGHVIAGSAEEWWLDDDDDVAPNELRTKIVYPVRNNPSSNAGSVSTLSPSSTS
jgi:effector-binding domain-containing protein